MKQIEMDITTEAYDNYSSEYINRRFNKLSLFNDYIEAPAIRDMLNGYGKFDKKYVLDVGCGPGIYSKSFYSMGANVVAIDPSERMLSAAKEYCSTINSKGNTIEFIPERLEDFTTEKKFSLIIATFMLGYFDNLETYFNKMRSLLGDSGKIITSALHPERMFSTSRNEIGYILGDKSRDSLYKADFLGSGTVINLVKHSFEDIFNSANAAGLKINRVKEPLLDPDCNYPDKSKVDFYSRNHSIVIFEMSRK